MVPCLADDRELLHGLRRNNAEVADADAIAGKQEVRRIDKRDSRPGIAVLHPARAGGEDDFVALLALYWLKSVGMSAGLSSPSPSMMTTVRPGRFSLVQARPIEMAR